MAFQQNQTGKARNQFSARMVSNKTQATINFVNLTDDFARKIYGVSNVSEITAAQATAELPAMLNNERVSCIITDLTAERELVAATEF